MNNLDLVFSLFNINVFQQAKNNITDIQYYFDTNASTSGNKLIGELISAIKTYNFDQIDLPLFNSILTRCGKTPAESSKIVSELIKWKSYNKKQMEPAKRFLDDIVANSIIQRANRLYDEHPADFLKYLKNAEFKTSTLDTLSSTSFGQIDINSVMENEMSDGVSSGFEFINRSFMPDCKIPMGQIILVTMAPGVGKSMYGFAEALHMASQGKKCHYLAMGDLSYRDFIIRMSAIYSGLPFWDAKNNVKTIFNGISQLVGNNLEITIVPAGTLTADEYIDYVLSRDFEILFADYDGNFKVPGLENNMYLAYGDVYEKLTKLTLAGKLVFIMSQPGKIYWGNEILELSDVGESSKKQQTVDMIITRGRVVGNPNHLGKFKIAKNRRGEEGVEVGSIRLNNGRFMIVSDGVYDMLKQDKTKKNYTESDIRAMEASYAANANQIQQQLNQAASRLNNGGGKQSYSVTGPTPFSRP